MEACIAVEREVDKVLDKISGLRAQNSSSLEELLLLVRGAKQELPNGIKMTHLYFFYFYFNVNRLIVPDRWRHVLLSIYLKLCAKWLF